MSNLYSTWFFNTRRDVISGLLVALALIPEAIAFSIIAGVDPKVGLYASFSIATIIAFVGGRPGMISAATGAMALVIVSLVKDHGLQYLLAATILAGLIQIVAGMIKLGSLMRFVSKSVVTGFVNALAILIFLAQLPELRNVTWHVYALTASGLAIIYLLPRITTVLPSPLVTIVALTAITMWFGIDVRTVGDMGELPNTLPIFLIPDIPFTLETLQIIFPYSLTLAVVGLLESLMTASIVDDMTDTPSNKNRESMGQGIANVATGFLGGMAGCAMIGQSVINVKAGGRGRLSTLCAGVFLLILIVFLGDWVSQIPMAAVVAVMIMVSISTFDWQSVKNLVVHPRSSSVVMIATVVVTVWSHDLAKGVLVGVLLSAIFFAHKVVDILCVHNYLSEDGTCRIYKAKGQLFFASAGQFVDSLDLNEPIESIHIDLSEAHIWDLTAVEALERVHTKLSHKGVKVYFIGLNKQSRRIILQLANEPKKLLAVSR
ncbi:SulP family inorganic anion transporter [Oligella urethralis]|uniref:Sulfate transporter n=2 Tax=Oligella urethralis TaxID=90245 RepID=A0A095ZBL4_9BURK|nr:SulP family inorganic anion transporter [Oligella urethralis]KGF32165.1 sulfate transporter [Oligella urethralis DNF00040]SPY09146.1 Putative sulfate transporter ychM [Oligella urethralis]SUA59492.1 Putative sulfate transporter ychM [Oligella urethralis]SUA62352.1 Putative sulfate transporter ychM [Oligella urethralis]